jgi:cytochrome c-type biogenesis protein CcmF
MIPELGLLSLIIALGFSLCLGIIPWLGLRRSNRYWMTRAPSLVWGQFLFLAASYLCLTYSFAVDDFTVKYVAVNSSLALPFLYKLCALWGGHEGSMLLWATILSTWMLAVSVLRKPLSDEMLSRILVILAWVSSGFLLFILMTSNPFARLLENMPKDGQDLNPLLQDPGFIFHPPMLYMGYVGFSVAFAFALAALWAGRVESAWSKWTRPWTLAAWCFLTCGITLGSWWAYRELGWGGWWFWDPVENASFMPWLVGTALIHSLAVTEKRQALKAWTLLLAIMAFSLSLVGTFLVRSGVLTSVHSFAVDPGRGLFMLVFLLIVIGCSMTLFALRAHLLHSPRNFSLVCRESFLIMNNIGLTVLMLTVLLGTIYPLIIDGLGMGKLSVGAPYFNTVFIPLVTPLLVLMGAAPHLNWQQSSLKSTVLKPIALASLFVVILIVLSNWQDFNSYSLLGLVLSTWIVLTTIKWVYIRKLRLTLAMWGMVFAHLGIASVVLGITVSTNFGIEKDVVLSPKQGLTVKGNFIKFEQMNELTGPNYHGVEAKFSIKNKSNTRIIYPQKRIYDVGQMAMTDSAIDVNVFRDIYVALGEPISDDSWSIRVYYKPFIRWIWGGGVLILLGGIFALSDRRYYKQRAHIRNEVRV